MSETDLAERFDTFRPHLHAVAYRLLGSSADADDAVQESWLRLARSDSDAVTNLGGWLTTVVGRVALDMLRTRAARREAPLESGLPTPSSPGEELTRSTGRRRPRSRRSWWTR